MPFDGLSPARITELRDLMVLRAVRASLDNPQAWLQGAWRCGSAHCVMDWVQQHASGLEQYNRLFTRLWALTPSGFDPVAYNDWSRTTHRSVCRLVDRAIAELEHSMPLLEHA